MHPLPPAGCRQRRQDNVHSSGYVLRSRSYISPLSVAPSSAGLLAALSNEPFCNTSTPQDPRPV